MRGCAGGNSTTNRKESVDEVEYDVHVPVTTVLLSCGRRRQTNDRIIFGSVIKEERKKCEDRAREKSRPTVALTQTPAIPNEQSE